MKNLENALDGYFRCGADMANGKKYITQYLSQNKFPNSCIQGVMAYLSEIQKSTYDIEIVVKKANKSMDNIVCCSKLPCICSGILQWRGLLLSA